MRVFADYHHGGLYHAINMLFHDRLGWEVYRPIGMEWAEKGIWRYSDNPPTQRQYLDPVNCYLTKDGFYNWHDTSEMINHRCVTYDQFQQMDFDLILGTVYQHQETFYELQKRYKPNAHFARLVGNSGEPIDWYYCPNFIDTTLLYPAPPDTNYVQIHQEFPVEYFFYEDPPEKPAIRSYLNCFNETPYYEIYHRYKKQMPDVTWKMHGLNGDDGFMTPTPLLAQSMRESSLIWHIKQHGEGYGHIIHNAYAVGRPIVTVKSYYAGKMAEHFLIDGVTCIDLADKPDQYNIDRIKDTLKRENLIPMCKKSADIFKQYVSFDEDEQKIRKWIENLR